MDEKEGLWIKVGQLQDRCNELISGFEEVLEANIDDRFLLKAMRQAERELAKKDEEIKRLEVRLKNMDIIISNVHNLANRVVDIVDESRRSESKPKT